MIAIGILLLLLGIPSFLFLIIYAIYENARVHREIRKREEYFSDHSKACEEATEDKHGQLIMPEWFKKKYPDGAWGAWDI